MLADPKLAAPLDAAQGPRVGRYTAAAPSPSRYVLLNAVTASTQYSEGGRLLKSEAAPTVPSLVPFRAS